jgi:uridine phosphorylase
LHDGDRLLADMRQSELILNADGSMYHLNLKPGDVAPTMIIVGDPGGVERLSLNFDEVLLRKTKR